MAISIKKLTEANNETAVSDAITSLHKRGETLQLDVHKLLNVIAIRWVNSGDIRPAVQHVNDLLNSDYFGGMRKNAIRAWVEAHFGFVYAEEGENKGQFVAGRRKAKNLDLDAIRNVRWWEFKPEPEYKPFNFDEALGKLISQAKARVKANDERDTVDVDAVRKLEQFRIDMQNDTVDF